MQPQPAESMPPEAVDASVTDLSRRRFWRRIFWMALLVALLPTLVILLVSVLAGARGCMAAPLEPCMIGPISLGRLFQIAAPIAEWTAYLIAYGVVPLLALAYFALQQGFGGIGIRLLLALAAALLLAIVPMLGPALAMDGLSHPGRSPNEGGVGDCTMFGVVIGSSVHALATVPLLVFVSAVPALLTFAVYSVVALILRARRPVRGP